MDSLIAQTQQLHSLTFGQSLVPLTDVEAVLDKLYDGEGDLICLLEWEPKTFHSIVLKYAKDDRVYFFNPERLVSAPPGSTLASHGPLRRVEEEGLESLAESDFCDLFASGCCLIQADSD